ncbi:MAG: serine hydrolase [Clostridiales bacterium]|nr:serine hydrolase [Clostridiales bacterium]
MLSEEKFSFFCRAVTDFGIQHVILYQNGKEIFRHDWIPEEPQLQYSISKSFTGTAMGFALEEGLVGWDDPVLRYFSEELPVSVSENMQALRIHHLLTMQMGYPMAYLMGDQRRTMKETDWVRFLLSRPMTSMPGREFKYSNAGPYLAGVLLERLTGESLTDYLMPRLFEPLGIQRPFWETDPMGRTFGAGGLHLKTSEVARFGQLYLQQGQWEGKQVIPKDWVKKVWRTIIPTVEEMQDYSLLFWRSRHDSISAVGRFGQYCTIVPEKNLVIAINSDDPQDSNLLEYVWTYLYPYL